MVSLWNWGGRKCHFHDMKNLPSSSRPPPHTLACYVINGAPGHTRQDLESSGRIFTVWLRETSNFHKWKWAYLLMGPWLPIAFNHVYKQQGELIVLHDLEFTQLLPRSQLGCARGRERSICGPFAGNKMKNPICNCRIRLWMIDDLHGSLGQRVTANHGAAWLPQWPTPPSWGVRRVSLSGSQPACR
jgi:hypothetical protein